MTVVTADASRGVALLNAEWSRNKAAPGATEERPFLTDKLL